MSFQTFKLGRLKILGKSNLEIEGQKWFSVCSAVPSQPQKFIFQLLPNFLVILLSSHGLSLVTLY